MLDTTSFAARRTTWPLRPLDLETLTPPSLTKGEELNVAQLRLLPPALQRRAMSEDFSWTVSVEQYLDMYRRALGRKTSQISKTKTPNIP